MLLDCTALRFSPLDQLSECRFWNTDRHSKSEYIQVSHKRRGWNIVFARDLPVRQRAREAVNFAEITRNAGGGARQ